MTDFLVYTQAVRTSMYGRPGACYIDIAGDMVNAKVDRSQIRFAPVYRVKYLYIFLQSMTGVVRFITVELYPAARTHQ